MLQLKTRRQASRNMSFRPLDEAELATVAGAFADMSEPRLVDDLARQRAGRATVIVGWSGERPVGIAEVEWSGPREPVVHALFPDCAEIHSVQVDAVARSDGIGSRLLGVCEGMAVGRGMVCTGVAVAVDNVHAYALYLRLGYAESGRVEYEAPFSAGEAGGASVDLAPGGSRRRGSRMRFLLKRL